MTAGADFRAVSGDPDPSRRVDEVLPWVHEAANPYIDWMLGSPERAGQALERWMRREGSEIAIARTVGLYEDDAVVGGFIGLTGEELAGASRGDTLALLSAVPKEERPGLLRRAASLAELRRPVAPDEWFLSKLGVLASHRRGGRGRAVIEEFLERGRAQGLRRFRLDAWQPDAHVVGLYESVGFRTVAESPSAELGGTLLAMTATG